MTFLECCSKVFVWCPNGYAKTYAKAGLDMAMEGDMARVQALYILSNMSSWRGAMAKEVRAELKKIGKVK